MPTRRIWQSDTRSRIEIVHLPSQSPQFGDIFFSHGSPLTIHPSVSQFFIASSVCLECCIGLPVALYPLRDIIDSKLTPIDVNPASLARVIEF
jgi:hypothetical protein